jgi:hypothetical protein
MQAFVQGRFNPQLRELMVEASLALARLDADRLEGLALSCQALNRDLTASRDLKRTELVRQAQEAQGELAVFGRVLEATRANLEVMNRLRDPGASRLEYAPLPAQASAGPAPWALAETCNGNH